MLTRQFIIVVIAVLALAGLGSSVQAADKPAEPPKKEEPRKVNRGDIKAVVVAFASAFANGDKATARSLIKGSAKQLQYADALIDQYQAIIRFDKALKDRFGKEADEYLDHYEKLGQFAKKAEIEMDGTDKATATIDDDELSVGEEWELVKANGQWSIDGKCLWDPDEDEADEIEVMRKVNKATDEVTQKIIAGRYRTAEAAVDALDDAQTKAAEKE